MVWTVKVEVAFATQPMATTPVWTDVTQWLGDAPISITSHGRPDEFSEVQPTQLSLLLDNSDGRFTSGLVSSPYYPNVRIGRRIRVSVTRNAITYVRFDGHVNQWPTEWAAGRPVYAAAQITATDRLKRFGQLGEFRAMVSEEILLDVATPDTTHGSAYYPLGESEGATSAGNVTKQLQAPATITQRGSGGTVTFGQGKGPGTDELSAPLFQPVDAQNGKYLTAQLRTGVGGSNGIALEAFIRADNGILARDIAGLADPFDNRILLSINSVGFLAVLSWQQGVGEVYRLDNFGPQLNDNQTHHVVVTESLAGSTVTASLYLDGAQVQGTTYTGTGLMTANRLFVGGDPWERWGAFSGTISHVAAHSTVLTAARVAAHYNAGINGLQGESADARIGRFANWIGIPTGDRNLDASAATVGAQQTAGVQPVEAMRQVERLEQGALFISGDGKLTFHSRDRRYNLNPAFILDAAQKHLAEPVTFPADDFAVTNDMTVSRPDGASARYSDQSSINEFGLYRDSADIPAGSSDELLSAASWRVLNYGTPRPRATNVTVEVGSLEVFGLAVIGQVLAADVSTKFRLANLPAQAPVNQADLFIEGYDEQIDPPRPGSRWLIRFNTSPGDIYDVWQLGVTGHCELGVNTKVAMRTTATPVPGGAWPDTWPDTWP